MLCAFSCFPICVSVCDIHCMNVFRHMCVGYMCTWVSMYMETQGRYHKSSCIYLSTLLTKGGSHPELIDMTNCYPACLSLPSKVGIKNTCRLCVCAKGPNSVPFPCR